MRRVGTPVVIRVNDDMLTIARKMAVEKGKPLRTLLREIIEDVLKEGGETRGREMRTEIGICQNSVRFLGFLWFVKCGEWLRFQGKDSICPSCGWVRPPLPPCPHTVKIPRPI